MYDFIFYFNYIINLKKCGNNGARYIGAIMVFFCLFLHIAMLFTIFQVLYLKITGRNFLHQSYDYTHQANPSQEIFAYGIGIILIIASIFYYNNRRVEIIKNKYGNQDKREFVNAKKINILKFFSVFLLPFVVIIIFG